MPRYSGWGGGWPFMYMHQPGGWGEQTWGMGFGNRHNSNQNNNNNNNSNNLFSPYGDLNSPNTLNIDNLSGLFARLILQNHLTRLADMGCHGGALYGCSLPPSSSSSSSPHNNSHSHSHSHNCHGGDNNNFNNNNSSSSSSRCQVCVHTCPNATQPYMGTNNVFVIPAAHVQHQQQQQQQQQPPQVPGLAGASMNNNINMFLNGLGLALGGASNISGCGGGGGGGGIGGGLNLPPGFGFPGFGAGAPQINLNNGGFSCAACCNHIRM